MTTVIEICKELLAYESNGTKPIVIVGPDCTDKNKLRVYVNGGLLGKIYTGKHPKGKTELLNESYDDYYPKTGELKTIIKEAQENKNQNDVLKNPKYLEMGIKAIEERFASKKRDDKKQGDSEKERHVESGIVKKYMNTIYEWAIIDMEAQFSYTWFPKAKFSKETTKSPRFDLIVINENGIGIVELKVNNENCENMLSHYEHMEYVLAHPKKFHDEFIRRINKLKEFKLINEKIVQNMDAMLQCGDIPLWCGFLFVGGGIEGAQKIVRVIEKKEKINDIKFLYCDQYDLEKLDMNKMVSYTEFIK